MEPLRPIVLGGSPSPSVSTLVTSVGGGVWKNVLYTGPPGCGKSTIIEKIVVRLDRPGTGFFTREMRESGRRVGFSMNILDGGHGVLAHTDIRSPIKVGRYGVNLLDIDRIAVPSMVPANERPISGPDGENLS